MHDLAAKIAFLDEIVKDPKTHARFLNTLSLMELCGAQLISRALPKLALTNFVLEHVAEEYRHAFFLRKCANKIAQRELSAAEAFCILESKRYLRSLNLSACRLLKNHRANPKLPYLLTTFMIEARALPFYQAYQSVIEKNQIPISLKSIIAEEEDHLNQISEELSGILSSFVLEQSLQIEKIAFEKWIQVVSQKALAFNIFSHLSGGYVPSNTEFCQI